MVAGNDSGSAYIFVRNGQTWIQQAKLVASDAATDDGFGFSVGISGENAIVGAKGDDDAGRFSGSAYVFSREGQTWTQQAKLNASDASETDEFGVSAAIDGDYAVVGARSNDVVVSNSGAAYLFFREGQNSRQATRMRTIGLECQVVSVTETSSLGQKGTIPPTFTVLRLRIAYPFLQIHFHSVIFWSEALQSNR